MMSNAPFCKRIQVSQVHEKYLVLDRTAKWTFFVFAKGQDLKASACTRLPEFSSLECRPRQLMFSY